MGRYPLLKKRLAAGIILLSLIMTVIPSVSSTLFRDDLSFEPIQLIINDDGSGDPTDRKVDIPVYIPDSGITPTIAINFTIKGTNTTQSTEFYGDDPWEDWKNISVLEDILYPVNSTTLYHVGTKGDWICQVTPTRPGGIIVLGIDWPGNDSAYEYIDIVNGTYVNPYMDSFLWGKDCNLTVRVTDMDGSPVKNAKVCLIWEENNDQFNFTIGNNKLGNGLNGEYSFWIRKADQGEGPRKNITIAAQWYGKFWGYGKVMSFVPFIPHEYNFDIAYINEIYAELPAGSGVMFTEASFGLVINNGPETITYEDLKTAKITVTSDVEGASLGIGFNIYEDSFPNIEPNHAWGSINDENHFLVNLLKPDEDLLNMTPWQTFFFQVSREYYTGVAHFHISIQIGKRITYLETKITYVDSPEFHVDLIGGERVSSHLHYTNTAVGTLGPIAPILNYSSVRLMNGDSAQIQKINSLLKSRILQFIIPVIQFNVTNLSFSVTYPREIPQKPFFQRFLYMTGIQEDNITLVNTPHQIIVNGLNGMFFMVRGSFLQMNPSRFAFAGHCAEVTLIQ